MSKDKVLAARINIEEQIAKKTIQVLLDAGYMISVFDGEETALPASFNAGAIFAAMRSTDEDVLYVHQHSCGVAFRPPYGSVYFVYGNDGWDVIADNSLNLHNLLLQVENLAAKLCNEQFKAGK